MNKLTEISAADFHHREDGRTFALMIKSQDAPINLLMNICHHAAVTNGFWDNPNWNMGEKLMLMVSELAEWMEADRKGKAIEKCDKPVDLTNEEEEAADVFIRLADLCAKRGINLGRAVRLKHNYNVTRPYKHGKAY